MAHRSRVLGPVIAALLSATAVAVPPASASAPSPAARSASASGAVCTTDVFGHTTKGTIKFRRVVNGRVTVAKSTTGTVSWRPVSWGLVMFERWPGHETTWQVVASTDGKVRLVETVWDTGSSLRVRVLKVLGTGLPSRLITFDDSELYWIGANHSLNRAKYNWSKERLSHPVRLPVTISGASAISSRLTDHGMRLYYTTRKGALHAVAVDGARSTDTVLRAAGYRSVTGLRTGDCSPRHRERMRPAVSLLSADRRTESRTCSGW